MYESQPTGLLDKARVPTLFLKPSSVKYFSAKQLNKQGPPSPMGVMGSMYKRVSFAELYEGERKSVNFPIRACRVWVNRSPGRNWWDRKSLDEGAHYGGERWEEVRAAEYHVTGNMYH